MKDLSKLPREQLDSALAALAEQMAGIKAQLDEAKGHAAVEGDYSDREWFNSARNALRIKGQLHQQVAQEIGRRNRLEKAQRANAREVHFVRIARRRLDPDLFREIMDEAKDAEVDAMANVA